MKKNGPMAFIVMVLLIAAMSYVAISGITIGSIKINNVEKAIRWGMDLKGGLYAEYQASPLAGSKVTNEDLVKTQNIMIKRLDNKGYNDSGVSVDEAKNRVIVEIPSVKNPEKLMDIIGKPAVLQFKDPKGNVIVSGKDIKSTSPDIDPQTGENVVSFELNSSGREKFADATTKYVGQIMPIVLDGKVISTPKVDTAIPDGKGVINGMKNAQEAKDLSNEISSGALPVKLQVVQSKVVDSILGAEALNTALLGGLIAIILVFVFMILFYKIPGIVADLALLFHTLLLILVFGFVHVTLTLPGVAGIVLSIGMAVDANVIIFERMKEELSWGKSLKAAVEAGFSRAWTAILDGNMTTIISAVVLWFLGSGSIKGFAFTLGVGVVLSMFTAITLTRWMLRSLMTSKFFNNHKLFN